ncbi:MAG: sugar ABC transporter ATP-binding protein [Gemmataceae bacterium]|nr:sugar ABC transporter ATP-binding protein [Gemmataceae bacterium]
MADPPLLRMTGITKRFAGVTALAGVDFHVAAGEVHALVGENGAGKSTLLKVLTGVYRRDAGTIELEGQPRTFASPGEAQRHGVVAVYQEVPLLDRRTVAENILLGREPTHWGRIDWQALNNAAADVLGRLGPYLDPEAPLGSLDVAHRQLVAIARAASLAPRVLVLDEPTSAMPHREVEVLYDVVRRLRATGAGIIYVSHRFDELYALCDRVTVLRDGRHVFTRPLTGLEPLELVGVMLGKRREELRPLTPVGARRAPEGSPLLRVRDLQRTPRLQGVSLDVHAGEVVGLAGLLGSGRTETARVLFGLDPRDAGAIEFAGHPLRPHSPRNAIQRGIGFLAEDRRAEGIIPDLSVRENLTLAALPMLSRLGVVSRARQRDVVERFISRLRIRVASPEQPVRELSGGNQQKVLLARWLCRNPRLLILDEPTRGIDIGAKADIRAVVGELADAGLAVLLISSEIGELIEECARLVVLRDGRSAAELRGADVAEGPILRAMAGDRPREAAT